MTRSLLPFAWIALIAALPGPSASGGQPKQNLLEEGASFEVGVDGFNLNNQYLFSHHGKEIAPVMDDTTAVHGRYSLRLDNPLGDKIYLTFRPLRVPRTTAVTVSGYVKGVSGSLTAQLMRWPWQTVAQQTVTLTDQWARFSFPGEIKSDQAYFLWILPGLDAKTVWIDALQIEEGELSDFHPRPLEFSLTTTAPRNTYAVGEDCELVARLYSERPPEAIPVRVRVLDLFRNEVLQKTVAVATHGRKHAEARIPLFPGDRRGSYKVIAEAKLDDLAETEILTFGVLKPPAGADPFFGFQVKNIFNDDSERRYAENNPDRELVYSNADPRQVDRLVRLAGAASVRCFRAAEWRKLQDQAQGYVFRDSWLALMKDDGLDDPLVVLNAVPPKWVEAVPVGDVARYAHQQRDRKVVPTLESWKQYVRTYVGRYKGKTRYYEVVNEPETIFPTPELYVEYLKAAHDVIRETDPDARIVAPSYSGRNPFTWIEGFVKAGGHRYADIWAIHYAGRTLPEQGMDEKHSTWDVLRKYREVLVEANGGRDKPLWNTEGGSFYWIEEHDAWPIPDQPEQHAEHWPVRDEPLAAAYAARLQLIEKASGVDRLYTFELGFYYSHNASKSRDCRSSYVNYDGSPSPALVAYNAVADLLAGARPVALLPLADQVVAVVFERGGKTVGGLWKGAPIGQWSGFEKYDPPVEVSLALPPRRLAVTNMLGHPIDPQPQGPGLRLTATAFPVYFTSGLPPAEVVEALRKAATRPGPRPKIDAPVDELIRDRYYSAAIARLEQGLAANPKDDVALAKIGECRVALKDLPGAYTCFDKALQASPESAEANAGMAHAIHDMTQAKLFPWFEGLKKAVPYCAKAVEKRPDDLLLRFRYWYCVSPTDPAKALEQIDAAERIDPQGRSFMTKRMRESRKDLEKRVTPRRK